MHRSSLEFPAKCALATGATPTTLLSRAGFAAVGTDFRSDVELLLHKALFRLTIAMANVKDARRHKIFVDRHVQGGIVLRLFALWILTGSLAAGIALAFAYINSPTTSFTNHLTGFGSRWTPTAAAMLSTLPIATLYLLRFTHRFAGPIVRLRRSLRELAAGEQVTPLKFRDGDFWQPLAGEFNDVATALGDARRRIAELEQQLHDTSSTREEAATTAS